MSTNNPNQTPENLVHIITFNINAIQTINGGIIPWVNIAKANEEILNLIDADEIVITENEITIIIDYPLTNPVSFDLFSATGFSRKLLLIEIRAKFLKLSREMSFENFGLDLVALDVYKTDSGKVEVTLDIDH